MIEVKFSKHAKDKINDSTSKKLNITEDRIRIIFNKPEFIDNSEYPVIMAIGKLNKDLFRGRYESKILSRR